MFYDDLKDKLQDGIFLRRRKWKFCEFIYFVNTSSFKHENLRNEAKHAHLLYELKTTRIFEYIIINPRIDKKLHDGSIACGWKPSDEEKKADDWEVFNKI